MPWKQWDGIMKLTMLGTGFATATKCYNTCFALSNEQEHFLVDACETAQCLGVKNLILYHTEDKNLSRRKGLYIAEGKPWFSGNLYVPEDLEIFKL